MSQASNYYWSLAGVTRHSKLYYLLQGWLHRGGRFLRQHLAFLGTAAGIGLLLLVGYLLILSSNLIERRLQADYSGLLAKLRLENSVLRTEIDVLRGLRIDFVAAASKAQQQQQQTQPQLSEKEEKEEVFGSSPQFSLLLLKSAETLIPAEKVQEVKKMVGQKVEVVNDESVKKAEKEVL
ncbi:hypothetical protein TYRP_020918 [Tyrophagus putrescentiae]|nr:hypothetical protein TYRP_020918 [Tyrophagus putrescentiae]